MRDLNIVEALPEHAAAVALRIRAEDAAEVWAIGRVTPLAAVELSLEHSVRSWTWIEGGEPLAVFGVATDNLIGDLGRPWLLTSAGVAQHRTRFARLSLSALKCIRGLYPRLENRVDARYAVCVRYLRWLGFTVHPAEPYGLLGLPFHRFEIGVP